MIVDIKNELRGFIDAEGRLTKFPSKRRKKLCALVYISDKIPADKCFTERKFNELLSALHTFGDTATLRREMYDYWLINREADGTRYCLNPERPSIEELTDKYCK